GDSVAGADSESLLAISGFNHEVRGTQGLPHAAVDYDGLIRKRHSRVPLRMRDPTGNPPHRRAPRPQEPDVYATHRPDTTTVGLTQKRALAHGCTDADGRIRYAPVYGGQKIIKGGIARGARCALEIYGLGDRGLPPGVQAFSARVQPPSR